MWRGCCRIGRRSATSRHSWNYRELIERAPASAAACGHAALRPGDRVLLSLENCGEFFELLFGCWGPGYVRCRPMRGSIRARSNISPTIRGRGCWSRPPALPRGWRRSPARLTLWPRLSRPAPRITTRLLYAEPLRSRAGETDRPCLAVLHFRHYRTAERRDADPPQPPLRQPCYYADIDLLDERDTHLLAAPVSHGAGLYALPFLLKGGAPDRAAAFRCRPTSSR